ncbi:hypothetical protein [Chloroflexus sp.]|uniref:hypothetical protein n=1 Tax=Chloroflexus sp. TaxID=1904827 RepID=UPI002ACEA95D|nr:hypothetical protein [Chloroflexus sp.]
MKRTAAILAVIVLAVMGLGLSRTAAQSGSPGLQAVLGTAFTYQGRLTQSGGPVNGTCDVEFRLFDDAAAGAQIGSTQTKTNVTVTNGVFTVALDFGANAFNGDARWLAISVRCPAGSGSYTALSPRQPLTPAPYALALPGLRTQPNATSPNLIGGFSGNSMTNGVVGSAIGGGGSNAFPNRVTDDYSVVSGGYNNQAGNNAGTTSDRSYATVGGGISNTASGEGATIGGGGYNIANDIGTTIGGGNGNNATGSFATVGGGTGNDAGGAYTVIGGGYQNTASEVDATVGGGNTNQASGRQSTVSGGYQNIASGIFATVPGGAGAKAANFGQMAYASGSFFVPGDAQTSTYVLRNLTDGSTSAVELFLDGSAQRIAISEDRTVVFEALIVGRRADGVSAGFRLSGVIANINGSTSLLGVTLLEKLGSSPGASSWTVIVLADDSSDSLRFITTGAPFTAWVATVRTVEVEVD